LFRISTTITLVNLHPFHYTQIPTFPILFNRLLFPLIIHTRIDFDFIHTPLLFQHGLFLKTLMTQHVPPNSHDFSMLHPIMHQHLPQQQRLHPFLLMHRIQSRACQTFILIPVPYVLFLVNLHPTFAPAIRTTDR
jgi:hypothetical protein